ncbi:unnamed protein product, partial [Rotaria magnacalcarata]
MNHTEGYESPRDPYIQQQQTPIQNRKQTTERTTNKRPRSYVSPSDQQQTDVHRKIDSRHQQVTHPAAYSKISFPPIVVKFKADQQASIKEITDDLILKWKNQHGIDLIITARFGHMHSLLVFADDSSTFESLLDPNRWPRTLNEVEIAVNIPRQFPPAYSLIIQQFHRNWSEDEWLIELQQRYVSLYKITRMRVKDGSPLNAVRADFKSIEEVKTLIESGKINIGSMIHPVKLYHLPMRVNKCLKCLRHDHTTKSCSQPRLCPRCAQEHSLEHGCHNNEKCVNCGGDHISVPETTDSQSLPYTSSDHLPILTKFFRLNVSDSKLVVPRTYWKLYSNILNVLHDQLQAERENSMNECNNTYSWFLCFQQFLAALKLRVTEWKEVKR